MRNSTYPGPRPAVSLLKYGLTPRSSVYQRVAAARSSAHRFMVLIPRSMMTPFPTVVGFGEDTTYNLTVTVLSPVADTAGQSDGRLVRCVPTRTPPLNGSIRWQRRK